MPAHAGLKRRRSWRRKLKSWLAQPRKLPTLPIVKTVKSYRKAFLTKDLRAGINLALLALPQGMAYALVAGLPIQYGIFGSAVAALLAALFAPSRYIVLGPTNATAIMLMSSFTALGLSGGDALAVLPLMLIMVGTFLIIGAYLKAASLTQYISSSVITGYMTAAALLIMVNQIKGALGLHLEGGVTTFFEIAYQTIAHIHQTHWPSLLCSALSLAIYWGMGKKWPHLPNVALVLILMATGAFFWNKHMPATYALEVFPPFFATDWNFTLPSLSFSAISQLASFALAIAFFCLLEGISIGKSLAARAGKGLNTNAEVVSMGMANLGCGLFSGMPASGSLTRSMLNWSTGGVTPISSLIKGLICTAAALTVGPLTGFLPKATLSIIVVWLGACLINWHQIRVVNKTTRSDAIVFVVTFASALLFRLDTAIFLGTGIAIMLFLRKASMPDVVEYAYNTEGHLTELSQSHPKQEPAISIVHVEGNLFFGAAELFRTQMRLVCSNPMLKVVILKMRNAYHLDATSVFALEELAKTMKEENRILLICEVKSELLRIFRNSGLVDVIGPELMFRDSIRNPNLSTAKAVRKAREFIGSDKPQVTIF